MVVEIEKVKEILKGIDVTETDSELGWWETSDGANFGSQKLQELIEYLKEVNNGRN